MMNSRILIAHCEKECKFKIQFLKSKKEKRSNISQLVRVRARAVPHANIWIIKATCGASRRNFPSLQRGMNSGYQGATFWTLIKFRAAAIAHHQTGSFFHEGESSFHPRINDEAERGTATFRAYFFYH